MSCFFFFQAEDGIRDADVTGVQTCALPICPSPAQGRAAGDRDQRPPVHPGRGGGLGQVRPLLAVATRPGCQPAARADSRGSGDCRRGGARCRGPLMGERARANATGGMMTTAIQAEGLVKHFGPTRALDGVDLRVPAGTVLGLLGPNGSGKTTTVRILTTLLEPDAGRAVVAGYDLSRQPMAAREIGRASGRE